MSEYEAVSVQAATIPARRVSGLTDVRNFVSGLLFTAAVAAVGTLLFTAALVVGVVGSPVIAAIVAWVIVRNRRLARARAWTA